MTATPTAVLHTTLWPVLKEMTATTETLPQNPAQRRSATGLTTTAMLEKRGAGPTRGVASVK